MAKGELLFDLMAERYARAPIADIPAYEKKLAITRNYLTPESRVFEFGCGTGSTALLHAPHVGHITATDYSKKMIEIAKRKQGEEGVENVDFVRFDINTMEVDSEQYDVVLGLNILHLMEDIDAPIDKCFAILKPGGYFISSSVCLVKPPGIWRFLIPVMSALQIMPKMQGFNEAELLASHRRAGFEIAEQYNPNDDGTVVFLVARKPEA